MCPFCVHRREFIAKAWKSIFKAADYHHLTPTLRPQQTLGLFVLPPAILAWHTATYELKTRDISLGVDRGQWIMTARKKSDQSLCIPLLHKAQVIMQKYQGNPLAASTGTVFAALSKPEFELLPEGDCRSSRYKKETDVSPGGAQPSRPLLRSLTAYQLRMVSKMLSHASIRTTQIYAKVVEKKVSQDIRCAGKTVIEETPLRAVVGNS